MDLSVNDTLSHSVVIYYKYYKCEKWDATRMHATAGYESPILNTDEDGSLITTHCLF